MELVKEEPHNPKVNQGLKRKRPGKYICAFDKQLFKVAYTRQKKIQRKRRVLFLTVT